MGDVEKSLEAIRHRARPNVKDYIAWIFPDFIELKGDRLCGDDTAIIGGLATLNGRPITVIGQIKGRNLEENLHCNFSMPKPEGYRKALRLMKPAEKFQRPVVCFVDTVGADPGESAEAQGQGTAIANNLMEMMNLRTILISILIGDGGSGGALALCVADRIAALENAVLSVISPKACADILWKDSSQSIKAARMLHITAQDLLQMNIIDKVLMEPGCGAHTNPVYMADEIRKYLVSVISDLQHYPTRLLIKKRNKKFRNMGLGKLPKC